MKSDIRSILVGALFVIVLSAVLADSATPELISSLEDSVEDVESQTSSCPEYFSIDGLVESPINISYSQLRSFLQVSEVAALQCLVTSIPPVIFNWTGVPLFYLLNLAKVIPGDYREVVFHASDNFSKGVPLETAMHPTSIIALTGNGTDLEQVEGFGNGYRVVFPCRWGYKWVKWIDRITVIDYVFTGSDPALMPNCTMPETNPILRTFNVTEAGGPTVEIMSDSTIESMTYQNSSKIVFAGQGEEGQKHFWYVSFSKTLLPGQHFVHVDGKPTYFYEVDSGQRLHLYFEQTVTSPYPVVEILNTSAPEGQNRKSEKPLSVDK
jgi:hypothetical protein